LVAIVSRVRTIPALELLGMGYNGCVCDAHTVAVVAQRMATCVAQAAVWGRRSTTMSAKDVKPDKSDGIDTISELVASAIKNDFSVSGARVGTVVGRVISDAAYSPTVADVGSEIDRLERAGDIRREGDRLYWEGDE